MFVMSKLNVKPYNTRLIRRLEVQWTNNISREIQRSLSYRLLCVSSYYRIIYEGICNDNNTGLQAVFPLCTVCDNTPCVSFVNVSLNKSLCSLTPSHSRTTDHRLEVNNRKITTLAKKVMPQVLSGTSWFGMVAVYPVAPEAQNIKTLRKKYWEEVYHLKRVGPETNHKQYEQYEKKDKQYNLHQAVTRDERNTERCKNTWISQEHGFCLSCEFHIWVLDNMTEKPSHSHHFYLHLMGSQSRYMLSYKISKKKKKRIKTKYWKYSGLYL